jgi:hypothetical protein
MKLVKFQDRTYLRTEKGLFIWESTWDTFRPVESVVWNPTTSSVEPYFGQYISDIFDTHYGYRTDEMHTYCVSLTDAYVGYLDDAPALDVQRFWAWSGVPLAWSGDRQFASHPCHPNPDRKAFLQRYALAAKTYKRSPRSNVRTRKVRIQ